MIILIMTNTLDATSNLFPRVYTKEKQKWRTEKNKYKKLWLKKIRQIYNKKLVFKYST